MRLLEREEPVKPRWDVALCVRAGLWHGSRLLIIEILFKNIFWHLECRVASFTSLLLSVSLQRLTWGQPRSSSFQTLSSRHITSVQCRIVIPHCHLMFGGFLWSFCEIFISESCICWTRKYLDILSWNFYSVTKQSAQCSVFFSDITVLYSYMMVLFLPLLRRLRDSVHLSVSKITPKVLNGFYWIFRKYWSRASEDLKAFLWMKTIILWSSPTSEPDSEKSHKRKTTMEKGRKQLHIFTANAAQRQLNVTL